MGSGINTRVVRPKLSSGMLRTNGQGAAASADSRCSGFVYQTPYRAYYLERVVRNPSESSGWSKPLPGSLSEIIVDSWNLLKLKGYENDLLRKFPAQ